MTRGFGDIYPYRRGGVVVGYRAGVYIAGRKVWGEVCPTRKLAEPWLKELRQRKVEVESGAARRPNAGRRERITVDELGEKLRERWATHHDRERTDATLRGYRNALAAVTRELGNRRIDSIDESDVRDLLRLWKHLAPQTRRNRLDRLAQLVDLAIELKYIPRPDWDVTRPAPRIAQPRTAPAESRVAELEAALEHDTRARCALLLAADAGLRLHEIAGLDGGQVDLAACWLRGVRGKGGTVRHVPIQTARLACALAAQQPRDGVSVLGVGVHGLAHLWARALPDGPGAHECRHLAATRWANDPTVGIARAQAWLGHADPRTTAGYVHQPGDAEPDCVPVPIGTPAGHALSAAARGMDAPASAKPRHA